MKSDVDSLFEFDEGILTPSEHELVLPIRTIPKNEFKIRDYCQALGIVSYLPLVKTWKISSYVKKGRSYRYSKEVFRPMFKSYVFARINAEQKAKLWASHLISSILKPDSQEQFLMELRAVHAFELTGLQQELEFNADVHENDQFIIETGVWAGVRGWLEKKEKRYEWAVWLDFVSQYVRTTIDPSTMRMTKVEA